MGVRGGGGWGRVGVCCPCRRFFSGAFVPVKESVRWGRSFGLGTVATCTPIRFGILPVSSPGQPRQLSLPAEGEAVDGQDEEQAGVAAGARAGYRCDRRA